MREPVEHIGHYHTLQWVKSRRRWVVRGRQWVEDHVFDRLDCYVEAEFTDQAEARAYAERAGICYEHMVPLNEWSGVCELIQQVNEYRSGVIRTTAATWHRDGF